MAEAPVSRQVAYQQRHRALGLCIRCSRRVLPKMKQCARHAGTVMTRRPRWEAERLADFVKEWNKGTKIPKMMARFGLTETAVYARAKTMRQKGVQLEYRTSMRLTRMTA